MKCGVQFERLADEKSVTCIHPAEHWPKTAHAFAVDATRNEPEREALALDRIKAEHEDAIRGFRIREEQLTRAYRNASSERDKLRAVAEAAEKVMVLEWGDPAKGCRDRLDGFWLDLSNALAALKGGE